MEKANIVYQVMVQIQHRFFRLRKRAKVIVSDSTMRLIKTCGYLQLCLIGGPVETKPKFSLAMIC